MPKSPKEKFERAIISFPFAERPVTPRGDISPEDEARSDRLAADLRDALTRPLTADELAAADAQVARSDRAYALLDELTAAAARDALDLVEVEQGDDQPSRFFVLLTDSDRGDEWGERIGELLLGDETTPPEGRDGE